MYFSSIFLPVYTRTEGMSRRHLGELTLKFTTTIKAFPAECGSGAEARQEGLRPWTLPRYPSRCKAWWLGQGAKAVMLPAKERRLQNRSRPRAPYGCFTCSRPSPATWDKSMTTDLAPGTIASVKGGAWCLPAARLQPTLVCHVSIGSMMMASAPLASSAIAATATQSFCTTRTSTKSASATNHESARVAGSVHLHTHARNC